MFIVRSWWRVMWWKTKCVGAVHTDVRGSVHMAIMVVIVA